MTDLTDRMRTCVAGLQTIEISITLSDPQMEAIIDARALLQEAADTLEAAGVGLVLMDTQTAVAIGAIDPAEEELLRQIKRPVMPDDKGRGVWIDPGVPNLPPTQPLGKSTCPNCDSRTTKTVHVKNKKIVLECPVCGHEWKR